jgi:hypothetical protein
MTNPTLERRVCRIEGVKMSTNHLTFIWESVTHFQTVIAIGEVNIGTIQIDGLLLITVVFILVARR